MLYPRLLERDFDRLPRVLRDFHSLAGRNRATGRVAVRHECFLAAMLGFPPAGDNISLELEVLAGEYRETWIRNFGGKLVRTEQWQDGNLLVESMGLVRIEFRILADEAGMQFFSEHVRLWIIPIPLHVSARVRGGESSWDFEVNVNRIGSYHGEMVPSK